MVVKKYDDNGNLIYYKIFVAKSGKSFEAWLEYNQDNKVIHGRNSDGYEFWREFHEDGTVTLRDNQTNKSKRM